MPAPPARRAVRRHSGLRALRLTLLEWIPFELFDTPDKTAAQ